MSFENLRATTSMIADFGVIIGLTMIASQLQAELFPVCLQNQKFGRPYESHI